MSDLAAHSVVELAGLLRAGELGAAELAAACFDAIAAREGELHAWAHLDRAAVMAWARKLDSFPADERGPLHGIPVGVKDIIDTADQTTEYGSPIYAGHRPADDAEVVARLRAAGAVVIGKTVTTEFALFRAGPTTNPHDVSRTPGGSSSGSAAAVGAGTVPLALGTQTAGSVVRPASYCGVVGVKPTFGAIPTHGIKPCSPALDTVGVFTRDVSGAAYALRALSYPAPGGLGAPSAPDAGGAVDALRAHDLGSRERVRVGFARTTEWPLIPAATRTLVEQAVDRVAADLEVEEIELPFAGLVEAQACVMNVEASQSLSRERAHHADQLSPVLLDVLRAGDHAAWAYEAARGYVELCRHLLETVLAPVDVLLVPSVLGEAPRLEDGTGDPLLCRAWTALGTPAVSVPGLTGPAGLPLGMQVVAAPGRDDLALVGAQQVGEFLR
jgi:Asp-tRNA(Asn)/Glu-tRNA(Gln) amidotransferase A subunit family amidase